MNDHEIPDATHGAGIFTYIYPENAPNVDIQYIENLGSTIKSPWFLTITTKKVKRVVAFSGNAAIVAVRLPVELPVQLLLATSRNFNKSEMGSNGEELIRFVGFTLVLP